MRAIVLDEPGKIRVEDNWPEPEAGPDDVIVEIGGVGLCGTDLAVYDGTSVPSSAPWVMGHEGGGTIVAIGSAVSERAIGQRVIIEPNWGEGTCPACLRGRTSACECRTSLGFSRSGLLAERVAIPAAYTWVVGDTVSDAAIACFEPLVVAHNAVRRANIPLGEDCLVVGAGSVGQVVCQALIAEGAQPWVIEPHEGRLGRALRMGAKQADERVHAKYRFIFETSGVALVWPVALEALDLDGTLTQIGFMRQEVALTPVDLVRGQKTIRGHLIYDHPGDFAATLEAVTAGRLVPDAAVEAVYPADRAAEAFAAVRTVPGKTWIDFNAWREHR